jgi:hypothetical protein
MANGFAHRILQGGEQCGGLSGQGMGGGGAAQRRHGIGSGHRAGIAQAGANFTPWAAGA